MYRFSDRNGFVLPFTIVLLFISAIFIGMIFRFVNHTSRMTRIYTGQTKCRLAAQSAIEGAKEKIQKGFAKYTGGTTGAMIKIDPKQAIAYNWFDNVSADHLTIGVGYDEAVTLESPITIDDCTVYIAIGKHIDHKTNASKANVPIIATAVYEHPDGLKTEITIQERICFATGQSQVFNYAYFLNNYGWMNGSSIIINGDMRANGNISVNQSIVNGYIYAAANDELGVDGEITLQNSPKIYTANYYRSKVSDSARPTSPTYDGGQKWVGGFEAPAASTSSSGGWGGGWGGGSSGGNTVTIKKPTTTSTGTVVTDPDNPEISKPIVNEGADSLPMPYVSNLDNYVDYAKQMNGTLYRPTYTFTDSIGDEHTVTGGTINAHYNRAGPSGSIDNADKGALVLIGTQDNPIVINGPVVVDSDVIIKGYVKGQGTIYSGRNVHIIGDIKYVDPPTWEHPDTNPEETRDANRSADLLGLIAKGNIVMGDYSSDSWHDTIDGYINGGRDSVVEQYTCDDYDYSIGYPKAPEKFCGDYTAIETVGEKLKLRAGTVTEIGEDGTEKKKDAMVSVADRRYYESVCDDKIISDNSESISRIDAVLYNNHGIFGTIGKRNTSFHLNGSLICRDEALVSTAGNGLNFNWDIRLRPDSAEGVDGLGLPVGPQDPYTTSWMQVPNHLNPSYPGN